MRERRKIKNALNSSLTPLSLDPKKNPHKASKDLQELHDKDTAL